MSPHFTLAEMKARFSAILLDLRSQLCYDSVKTCQISKGLANERHCVTWKQYFLTDTKPWQKSNTFATNAIFFFSAVAALQCSSGREWLCANRNIFNFDQLSDNIPLNQINESKPVRLPKNWWSPFKSSWICIILALFSHKCASSVFLQENGNLGLLSWKNSVN